MRVLTSPAQTGAVTLAQDRSSSVVYGMPGAAVALGAVERVLPPEHIAAALAAAVVSEREAGI
jgi:two-component system chemotaxis response regulator CheB